MKLFIDTSALVKYFHDEEGTGRIVELLDTPVNEIWVSDLARVEFLSALHRKARTGELGTDQLQEAIIGFYKEWERFQIQPLARVVLTEAERLLREKGRTNHLRALDALQYASFSLIAEDDWWFVVADERLATAVSSDGFQVINVMGSPG